MLKERKEYRKKFNAAGQIFLGGETLCFSCHDVSVKGAMLDVLPGILLTTVDDFVAMLNEDQRAEIFIEDLMMSGEANVIWAKENDDRVLLGVEFTNVLPNAVKLWRLRRNYRKKQVFSTELIIEKDRFNVEAINFSLDGVCLRTAIRHPSLKVDALVKLHVPAYSANAFGKVIWINEEDGIVEFGLQIITM